MYWDEEYAKQSKYGELTTPPIMVSYMSSRVPPGESDVVTQGFEDNPMSDGIGDVHKHGELPPVPTNLVRVLNAGNELEYINIRVSGTKLNFKIVTRASVREWSGREPFLILP
ncbi:MAG: hypothetical protein CM1200mP15_09160 [Dehalococcoidia bacterium]|nr:MAG: hypothetical protein CM1200mP15_09160 [Dehalococcoidia bacterium]